MRHLPLLLLAFLALGAAGTSRADETVWSALRAGGVYVLMRHERAPGTGDPARFKLGDCTTQRNLDGTGRAAARRTGARLKSEGVRVTRVLTSQWCRCRETARLLDVGPVRDAPYLNSFFRDRSTRGDQTAALRARVSRALPSGVVVLVTHQVNITALTDIFPREGELIVLKPVPGAGRGFSIVGRLRP